MSSGLETNKIVGAILTALLVTVGIGHFGAALFGSGGHGEQVLAYPVAAGEAGPVEAPEPEVIPTVLPLLADASADDGAALFASRCTSCHSAEEGGANKTGPNLWDIVGKDIASHPDFSYSDALQALEGDWTYEKINVFVHGPREFAPGTRMNFQLAGLEDRANVIAYLRTLSSDPAPLPTQEEIDAAVAEQEAAMGGGEEEGEGEEASGEGASDDAAATDEGEGTADEGAADEGEAAEDPADESAAPAEDAGEDAGEAPAEDAEEEPAEDAGEAPAEEAEEAPAEDDGQDG